MDLNELLRSVKAPQAAPSVAAQRREMAVAQATANVGNTAAAGALAMLQRAAYHVAHEEARPAPRRRQREETKPADDHAVAATAESGDSKQHAGDEASLISYYDDSDAMQDETIAPVLAPATGTTTRDKETPASVAGVEMDADVAVEGPSSAAEASQRRFFSEMALGLCVPPLAAVQTGVLSGRLAASTSGIAGADLPSRATMAAAAARALRGSIGALRLRTAEEHLATARVQRAGMRRLAATALWVRDGDAAAVAAGTRVERTYTVTCVDRRPVKAVARDVAVDEWDAVDRSHTHAMTAALQWAVAGRTLPLRHPGATLNATAPLSALQAPRDLASALVGAFNGAATAEAEAKRFVSLTARLLAGNTPAEGPKTAPPQQRPPDATEVAIPVTSEAAAADSFDDLDDILC